MDSRKLAQQQQQQRRRRRRRHRPNCCCYSKQSNQTDKTKRPIGARTPAGEQDKAPPPRLMRRRARTGPPAARAGRLFWRLTFALLNLTSLALIESAPASGEPGESMIKVTRFQVPAQVKPGELRRLTCLYELHGATLHAMKLFKDDKEFYRFTPSDAQLTFPVVGVHVDQSKSNEREVWLKINKRSAGQYKCQVSVEGTFNSVSAEKRLEVLDAASPLGPAGSDSGSGHLAGASVWQQHLISQQQHQQHQQQLEGRASTRMRAPQAAVQRHPSQLSGAASSGSGGGAERSGARKLAPNWSLKSSFIISLVALLMLQIWPHRRPDVAGAAAVGLVSRSS